MNGDILHRSTEGVTRVTTQLDSHMHGLQTGTPEIASVGAIAFGPDGILFVADNRNAKIVAVQLDDDDTVSAPPELDNLDERLAAFLGVSREDVAIRGMVVHPDSGAVYLSVMRGGGDDAVPAIVRIGGDGAIQDVSLDDVPYSEAAVANAPGADDERKDVRVVGQDETPDDVYERGEITLLLKREPLRTSTVTDLAYIDGILLVAGASNEEFVATFRRIPFPFGEDTESNSLEIFHVSHGKWETHSPIRTFVPYGGGANVLAAYTCTPVVHFSFGDLAGGDQARGRTVAELGSMNTPIDMVSFDRDGEEYLLVSNARHPLIKIACRDVDVQEGLTEANEPLGVPRENLPHEGVRRLATANGHVLMLQWIDDSLHLRAYPTTSL
jgi:hypothetical protein